MKRGLWLLLLVSCATTEPSPPPSELVLCGGDEVFILDVRSAPRKVWSWRAAESPGLPEALRTKFGTTDDCKPVDGGRKILVTSSGGAAALIERSTKACLFAAAAPNAHSAELLPGGRVLLALSTHADGNRLALHDPAGAFLVSDELTGAHGVVRDEERGLLWALGTFELRAYALKELSALAPVFVRKHGFALPNEGGHELRPVPDRPELVLSTHQHVWAFDRDQLSFKPFPQLGDAENVKSLDFDPRSGALAYVKAEKSWWAERVTFIGLDRTVEFPGQKIYKARWVPPLD